MSQDKRKRTEPTLGDLDRLHAPDTRAPTPNAADAPAVPGNRHTRARRRDGNTRHAWWWPLLAVVLVAVLALAWVNQDRLRGLFPPTRLNTMLDQADAALAAGHLHGGSDSAQALYAEALQQEPDNPRARQGLRAVGQAQLAHAASAIDAGAFAQASSQLASARALLGGGAKVDLLAQRLRQAQHPKGQLPNTIDRARAALAAGHVAGADGAAALYHQALLADPDSQVARHGLNRAGHALAAKAQAALQHGDLAAATKRIAQLDQLVPHAGELPALRARLAQSQQATAAALEQHLTQGQAALRAGRFTGAGQDNALAQFQAARKLDPDNADARSGLQQVARALVVRANAAMDMHDAAQAGDLLHQAADLGLASNDLAVAQARLRAMAPQPGASPTASAASVAHDGLATVVASDGLAHPKLTPLQKVEIEHLLRRAQGAAQAGNIMLPPGQSAYDLYRQALTIDGNNVAALAGLQALSKRTEGLFGQALDAGKLERAHGYLQTLRSLEPGSPKPQALAQRLRAACQQAAAQACAGMDLPAPAVPSTGR